MVIAESRKYNLKSYQDGYLKSLQFRCFPYSDVCYSDPHCIIKRFILTLFQMLIHSGANVNAQDKEGRPPLHCVINSKLKGGTNCIKILLDNGADVNLVKIG